MRYEKVRSSKDMKVKRKMDASRPTKIGIYSNPKPVHIKLPAHIGSTLDDFDIEEIRFE